MSKKVTISEFRATSWQRPKTMVQWPDQFCHYSLSLWWSWQFISQLYGIITSIYLVVKLQTMLTIWDPAQTCAFPNWLYSSAYKPSTHLPQHRVNNSFFLHEDGGALVILTPRQYCFIWSVHHNYPWMVKNTQGWASFWLSGQRWGFSDWDF